jgi:multiple sugar transport system substrate-binding protein
LGQGLLIAGAGLLASTALAAAGTVRVTVAEYSAKTGPYFEKARAPSSGQIRHRHADRGGALGCAAAEAHHDISGNANADIAIIGTRWLIDFVAGHRRAARRLHERRVQGPLHRDFMSPSVMDGKTYGLPIAASAAPCITTRTCSRRPASPRRRRPGEEAEGCRRERSRRWAARSTGSACRARRSRRTSNFYYAMWSHGGDIIEADGTSG